MAQSSCLSSWAVSSLDQSCPEKVECVELMGVFQHGWRST